MPTPIAAANPPVSDELVGTLIDIARAASDESRGASIPETILLLRTVPELLEELLAYRRHLDDLFAAPPANVVPLRRVRAVMAVAGGPGPAPTGPDAA